jgi:hypothetical protein
MFCIYQLDNLGNEKVIDSFKSADKYLSKINDLIKKNYTYKSLDGITPQNVKDTPCFNWGFYLLINDKTVQLVEKYLITEKGYLYNTHNIEIKVLFTWKLLSFEKKDNGNKNELVFLSDVKKNEAIFMSDRDSEHRWDIVSDKKIMDYSTISEESDHILNTDKLMQKLSEYSLISESDDKGDDFRNFDLANIRCGSNILILGKRGSNAGTVACNIIDSLNMKNNRELLVISPSERNNPVYENLYPYAEILYSYDEETINEFIRNKKGNNACILVNQLVNMKNKNHLFELLCGRPYGINVIVSTQSSSSILPTTRGDFDYVFQAWTNFHLDQKRIYDDFGSMFPTFEMFRAVFNKLTENSKFRVVDRMCGKVPCDNVFSFEPVFGCSLSETGSYKRSRVIKL